MEISKMVMFVLSFMLIASAPLYGADHSAGHQGQMDDMAGMAGQQDGSIFLQKKVIDGYSVSFHVMKAEAGMEHEGKYNLMVKIEEQGKVVGDAVVNSKVIAPDGHSESKFLNKMGDWYMNGYSLGETGKYQLIILFKTADGVKHSGGVYYESTQE